MIHMFSGIVEASAKVVNVIQKNQAVVVQVRRPEDFVDLKVGDSIACNGACLTLDQFDQQQLSFVLAHETLKTLKFNPDHLLGQIWNLERSLKFGDRVHGHLMTGHIEALGQIVKNEAFGDSWFLNVSVPRELLKFIWKKGSLGLHGVSLTVNDVQDSIVSFCLIPETVRRTNLSQYQVGDFLNLETDYLAKAYLQSRSYEL